MATTLADPPRALPPVRAGEVFEIGPDRRIARIYCAAGPHPTTWSTFRTFGPVPTMRFDHHLRPVRSGERRAIAYGAPSVTRGGVVNDVLETCIAEVFAQTRVVDLADNEPWFTVWVPTRTLRLLDVVDCRWITRARGNGAISTGAHEQSQKWAKAIHATYPDVDGIYYEASNLPMRRSLALFERAESGLPSRPVVNVPLTHPGLRGAIKRIAHGLDFGLVV